MVKPIFVQTREELAQYEADLWATYHSTELKSHHDFNLIRTVLSLLATVQTRRKELMERESANRTGGIQV